MKQVWAKIVPWNPDLAAAAWRPGRCGPHPSRSGKEMRRMG